MGRLDVRYVNSLIRDVHRGSSDAFSALYFSSVDTIYARGCLLFSSIYDLQDYIRSIYIRLWKKMPQIRKASEFRAQLSSLTSECAQELLQNTDASSDGRKHTIDIPLTDDIRTNMLDDILVRTGAPKRSTPAETICAYNEYRIRRHRLLTVILVLLALAAAALPVFFIRPSCTIEETTSEYGYAVYHLHVNAALIPVKSVAASIDGHSMPVSTQSGKDYLISPSRNGTMYIRVRLANRQALSFQEEVTDADDTAPVVSSSLYDRSLGTLTLQITDEGSGVNPSSVTLTDESGTEADCLSYEENTHTCCFSVSESSTYQLRAEDNTGNILKAVIHLKPDQNSASADADPASEGS